MRVTIFLTNSSNKFLSWKLNNRLVPIHSPVENTVGVAWLKSIFFKVSGTGNVRESSSPGSFNNYVDQFWPNFDHLPPRVDNDGHFTYFKPLFTWLSTFGLSTDHLPPSSCPRSYWMTISTKFMASPMCFLSLQNSSLEWHSAAFFKILGDSRSKKE